MVSSSSRSHTFVGIDAIAQLPGAVVLPPIRSDDFVSQRHEVNPALALNLLKDIQSVVVVWQDQLRQLVTALRQLQAQGPMVDGWIESSAEAAPATGTEATLLRHGDPAALMQYIEALDAQPVATGEQTDGQSNRPSQGTTNQGNATQYRLCSLDESGRVQSQPCPAEQMGMVSLAIARYQKFKQLLNQKQVIETKLQKAVDQLTGVRATLNH